MFNLSSRVQISWFLSGVFCHRAVDNLVRISFFMIQTVHCRVFKRHSDVAVCELCHWKVVGGYEYAYNRHRKTYQDAEHDCNLCGGQLITAKNQDEVELMQYILAEL